MGCDKVVLCLLFFTFLLWNTWPSPCAIILILLVSQWALSKLALFANDVLLFVTQPRLSPPQILQEFAKFGEVSNFKVNNKSEILNNSLSKEAFLKCWPFPFKTVSTSICYLGIHVPSDGTQLFSRNVISPLLRTRTSNATKRWSWLGECFKNGCSPSVLIFVPNNSYPHTFLIFQEAPSDVLQFYLERGPTKYTLWNTGAPDASIYHRAAILTHILDWFHHS